MRKILINALIRYGLGILLIAGVGVALVRLPLGEGIRRMSYDLLFFNRDAVVPEDLVIVFLDDDSHRKLGQPYDRIWDRRLHAFLLDRLTEEGARLVLFDMIFDQASSDPEVDEQFAEAIQRNGRVILAAELYRREDDEYDEEVVVPPYAKFRRAAAGWGMVHSPIDPDHGIRILATGTERIPSATWRALDVLQPGLDEDLGARSEERWINFLGRPGSIPSVSYAMALEGKFSGFFKNKIVFVGAKSAVGFSGTAKDTFRSPFLDSSARRYQFFEGVEVHVSVLANLLNRSWFSRINEGKETALVGLLGAAFVAVFLPFGPRLSFLLLIVGAGCVAYTSQTLMWWSQTFYSWIVPVAIQAPGAFLWSTGIRYYTEQRRRIRLRRSFSAYLSPVMVKRMADADEEPQLGGHTENITSFFSDVQSFSSFSEILTPPQLSDLMNEYLTAMTDILHAEGGTLDKYIGDAIVAMFGAPIHLTDHSLRACVTAVRMQEAQKQLREKWSSEGEKWPSLVWQMRTRIGLNTGDATVGNMGSQARFNYTMMGDTVNLAARCESGAKSFGVYTLVTEDTKSSAETDGDSLVFRFLDRIVVKGRARPVSIYELVGIREDMPASFDECLRAFDGGFQNYLDRDWEGAVQRFHAAAEWEINQVNPETGISSNPSALMIQRCRHFQENPPPADWDGVFVMDTK